MRSITRNNILSEEAIKNFLLTVSARCFNSCTGKDKSLDKDRAAKLVAMLLRIINLYLQEEYIFNPTFVASSYTKNLTAEEESIRKELLDIILSLHEVVRGEIDGMEKMKAVLLVNELAAAYAASFTDFTYPIQKPAS
ncbi:MAG TPA: hypothetical protein PKA28_19580 [Methylomusa anaerophila]|uniref:Uncharacterized protein n=1 Tax=Methylomusa anaerophila TaxID=1930071 RepID=A0A348AIE5_9FIRM|nr:hypothetical protein [Methylomusa anaerophila]BBB90843.1 hypothetical protein MAMMFC1_01506 [Methylomusa anaerophila]HML90637.1 hypothetical protein [Methylomusa anaerophila]